MSDLSLTVILHNAEQAAMAIRNVAARSKALPDQGRSHRQDWGGAL